MMMGHMSPACGQVRCGAHAAVALAAAVAGDGGRWTGKAYLVLAVWC
jgi:hypothetical protein